MFVVAIAVVATVVVVVEEGVQTEPFGVVDDGNVLVDGDDGGGDDDDDDDDGIDIEDDEGKIVDVDVVVGRDRLFLLPQILREGECYGHHEGLQNR